LAKSRLVEAPLDSTAGQRPNFRTTQWGLVATASAEGVAEARVALEELYRLYCYPVYASIRPRGHGRHDAQDLTQDFFVHLLEKGTLGRADPQRGRFRNFLLGALDHFLANAARTRQVRQTGWRLRVGVFG
jgi:DNA-directed RNA polymerase specialized sigma24 family protein